jgi:hypothetical protein
MKNTEKKVLPDDYWSNYSFYKNKENMEIIINNIKNLPEQIIVTLYKHNKIYLNSYEKLKSQIKDKNLKLDKIKLHLENFNFVDYIKNEINQYKLQIESKETETKYDLVYRSRHMDLKIIVEHNFTDKIISENRNNVIIFDNLIFNKNFNIRYDQVEWLFNYCRLRKLDDQNKITYCVDGWVIEIFSNNNEYNIKWNKNSLESLNAEELVGFDDNTKIPNKQIVIELFLVICSNCPDDILNWNNYLMILEWYNDNYEYFSSSSFLEFYKINKKNKSQYDTVRIKQITNDFIDSIDNIPNNLISWTGEFIERCLSDFINIKKSVKNMYNQRLHRYDNDKLWEHMCKEELESSEQKFKNKNLNKNEQTKITSRFENINNIFEKVDSTENKTFFQRIFNFKTVNKEQEKDPKQISVLDLLVFNKFYDVSYEDVGWIINWCDFKWIESYTGETFVVDGWYFDRIMYSEPNRPNYKIKYEDSSIKSNLTNLTNLNKYIGDEEKRNIIRFSIQLGNESPDKYINFNNYYILSICENHLDSYFQSTRMFRAKIKYYNQELEKTNKIKLNPEQLIIKLDNKLKKEEIIDYLNYFSEFGQKTNYDLLLKETKNFAKTDFKKYLDLEFIDCIKDAQINTLLNLDSIDLTGFYELNGKKNTLKLINNINNQIKYRYNVHFTKKSNNELISKEELLAGMYNIAGPTGMGVLQYNDKTMGLEQAKKMLENTNYFDYLNGVRMKTSFVLFPIIDYERYDKSQGEGTFMSVINNIIKGKDVSRKNLFI